MPNLISMEIAADARPPALRRARPLLVATLVLGLAVAVAGPAVQFGWQLHQSDPRRFVFDEDAYYSFQVARNMVNGHGVTADRSGATDGFQPLWTFALTLPFLFGNTRAALGLVGAISLVLWLLGAWAFARILLALLPRGSPYPVEASLFFAVVFTSDSLVRSYYWNGLETGVYLTLLLVALDRFVVDERGADRSDLLFGVVLGLLALARTDGVVWCVALIAARWLRGSPTTRSWRRVAVPLVVTVAMLLPWVAFGLVLTGSALPQSGVATGAHGIYAFGRHLVRTFALATARDFVPWPKPFAPAALRSGIAAALVFGAELAVLYRSGIATGPVRRGLVVVMGAVAVVTAAYLRVSSAVWFLYRYLSSLRLLMLAVTALAAWRVLAAVHRLVIRHPAGGSLRWAPWLAGAGLVTVALVGVARAARPVIYREPGYMTSGVDAIAARADQLRGCGRIGMFESGRTGFVYGARIVNLDGKVDLPALHAILRHRLPDYIDSSRLDVILARNSIFATLTQESPSWTQEFQFAADSYSPITSWALRRGTPCAAAFAQLPVAATPSNATAIQPGT